MSYLIVVGTSMNIYKTSNDVLFVCVIPNKMISGVTENMISNIKYKKINIFRRISYVTIDSDEIYNIKIGMRSDQKGEYTYRLITDDDWHPVTMNFSNKLLSDECDLVDKWHYGLY